ncbi:MBOAT family O-acyltransferase [Anaerosalibacter bizertensis]|uniref:MBOAT family O-acyltransferase n=1 Tax=Anaerosalibacter bizertensis TaxID=932217 RepID=UPI001D026691|nr:MBOAT family protein [Anaerosalibacter bizertensis]MCB5559149.1 MBOAT family protein [Anaerosalibacter bizertensis]
MLFSSVVFLFLFLPAVIFCYYILGKKLGRKFKNIVLLIFSLFFYAYGEPKYLFVMLFSIIVNYILGLFVDKYRKDNTKAKLILALAVIINISIIGYYKYSNFLLENINAVFKTSIIIKDIVMPIGISFFTFQGLSYVIDIYRQNGKVQKNPLNVALYISFFPQLIAGPIVRYETVSEQIDERKETLDDFNYGVERFILGLAKKVLIANTVGLIADEIFNTPISSSSVILAWLGVISYTMQIYFDFSGYSDMAIGLGRMFGFKFLENFDYPYISSSVTEFWRRWHISLGTWFRDYVYIPLGGNRVNRLKHFRNIFIVWFLTGLWHGASWNFIIWGLYYGCILIIEKLFLGKYLKKTWKPIRHIYTMFLVVIGWLFFRVETLRQAFEYLKIMFGFTDHVLINSQAVYYLKEYKYALMISIIVSLPIYPLLKRRFKGSDHSIINNYLKPVVLIGVFALSIMYLINSTFNPFIYFRF